MKIRSKKIFLLLLMASAGLTAFAKSRLIEPPAHKNLFTLKADKEFVGAKVEVYDFSGQLITAQSLQKRKMVIDFNDVLKGTYTIKVVKGEATKEYKYTKK